jgi:hypothetical protein
VVRLHQKESLKREGINQMEKADKITVETNDGINWSLSINQRFIRDRFENPYQAYKFYGICTKCWFQGVKE